MFLVIMYGPIYPAQKFGRERLGKMKYLLVHVKTEEILILPVHSLIIMLISWTYMVLLGLFC